MRQDVQVASHTHGVVSPTPPPDGGEEDGERDRMLSALVGSEVKFAPPTGAAVVDASSATTPPAELSRPGLRKRKEAPDHYPYNRARRQRSNGNITQPLGFSSIEHGDDDDDDDDGGDGDQEHGRHGNGMHASETSGDVLPSKDMPNMVTTPSAAANGYADLGSHGTVQRTPVEPTFPDGHYRTHGRPTASLQDQSSSQPPQATQRKRAQSMISHTGTPTMTSRRGRRRSKAERTSNDLGDGRLQDEWSAEAMVNFFGESALLFSPPPGVLSAAANGSSNPFKFALSGRAPRNANFRCEFCGKKYINKAPLVTHRWEHHPSWLFGVRFGLPRRQQVQMMEAAQALLNIKYYPPVARGVAQGHLGSDASCTEEEGEEDEEIDGDDESDETYCDAYATTAY
ncbi:hypothetical protein THASP1DRAFT_28347 [Thamnocephalis sphaerospora]|uniref:C2H2-type domain-containing protein n=1 Tax=Thamnocephalis sphaerospora TaxID=78915 RepID=A0A4P9XV38_9FUNG|nr:hypothetical protein THASP1DRAFT_28347 [Thamnocephalis sphaerospora]|eukprot:RKP09862.1 hypothetical protein THASP1DRAFT_28347 [Thamnocephalis sphaerospora]